MPWHLTRWSIGGLCSSLLVLFFADLAFAQTPTFPYDIATVMKGFEGEWGYVASKPADSWFGTGLADGAGACGAPKALKLSFRDEPEPGAAAGQWRLRIRPEQPSGMPVVKVEQAETWQRITTSILDDRQIWEKDGDTLKMLSHDTWLTFVRCP